MYTASSISSLRIEPYPALSNPTPNPYIELLSGNSQHHLLPRRHFFPFKITPNITPSPPLSFSHTTQSRRSHRQQTNTLRMPTSDPRPQDISPASVSILWRRFPPRRDRLEQRCHTSSLACALHPCSRYARPGWGKGACGWRRADWHLEM